MLPEQWGHTNTALQPETQIMGCGASNSKDHPEENGDAPVEASKEDTPKEDTPKEDTPKEEAPKEAPVEAAPVDAPKEEAPAEAPVEAPVEAPKESVTAVPKD